jgi:hypothetical protein
MRDPRERVPPRRSLLFHRLFHGLFHRPYRRAARASPGGRRRARAHAHRPGARKQLGICGGRAPHHPFSQENKTLSSSALREALLWALSYPYLGLPGALWTRFPSEGIRPLRDIAVARTRTSLTPEEMLAGCVFLLTAIVAMPTGDSSGRLAQLEPAPLEKASPSRPELKAAKREVKLHLYDRNVWSMSANSNMLLAMTLGGKLRILADFLLDSADTGVPIDEQTLAYANHVRGLTDAQILNEAHTDAVKTTFAEGMLLMTTDEGEERGLTFTEEDIDRLTGTYHYSGGGDGSDRLDLGAAVSPPSPSASKKEKSVKTKAAVIYADIPCAALKWDPQLGFNGPTTVPYCFDPNINDG